MGPVDWTFVAIGSLLQILVFHQFARGWWRKFPVFFLFLTALILTTVVQLAAIIDDNGWTDSTQHLYWYSTSATRALMYLGVLHLIWKISSSAAGARLTMRLAMGSIVLCLCSLLMHWGKHENLFLTEVSRDISFLGLVLNFFLWMVLLRHGDRLLLAISSALGIQMAAEAIGHALRQMSKSTVPYGNFLVVIGDILFLMLWWVALRRSKLPTNIPGRATSGGAGEVASTT